MLGGFILFLFLFGFLFSLLPRLCFRRERLLNPMLVHPMDYPPILIQPLYAIPIFTLILPQLYPSVLQIFSPVMDFLSRRRQKVSTLLRGKLSFGIHFCQLVTLYTSTGHHSASGRCSLYPHRRSRDFHHFMQTLLEFFFFL